MPKKIRDTSKKTPKIDPDILIKGLGAEKISTPPGWSAIKMMSTPHFMPAPEGVECPKCGAKAPEFGKWACLLWGAYGGPVECKKCGYKEGFMSYIGKTMITVEPLPEGAKPE